MDRGQFDALAQVIARKRSRRAALATLVGAALLRRMPDAALAKSKGHGHGHGHGHGNGGGSHIPRSCYRHNNCKVGPGKHDQKCDFMGSKAFHRANARGIDLRGANLIGAQLDGADLTGANLSGACLLGANFTGAKLDQAKLGGAIFCQTVMPDGTVRDDDCGHGSACCPAPAISQNTCVEGIGTICSIFGNPCCSPAACVSSLGVFVTTCQVSCANDSTCTAISPDLVCKANPVSCPFLAKCCSPR